MESGLGTQADWAGRCAPPRGGAQPRCLTCPMLGAIHTETDGRTTQALAVAVALRCALARDCGAEPKPGADGLRV